MVKQLKVNRALAGGQLSLLLVASFLIGTPGAPGTSAKVTREPTGSQARQVAVAGALKASFGPSLQAVTAFKPYYLTGDFNGDAAQDIVIAVRINGQRSDLPSDVTVYNPFERPKAVFPADPAATPTVALAIIHGASAGWQASPVSQKFLLFGNSPALILNYSRVSDPSSAQSLMELLGKRSKKFSWAGWPPAAAKGDSIVLGTEATESLLYWTGKNYRWEEAAGGE